jgi:hypothetical protein
VTINRVEAVLDFEPIGWRPEREGNMKEGLNHMRKAWISNNTSASVLEFRTFDSVLRDAMDVWE